MIHEKGFYALGQSVYVLSSSYEADIVKPLMYFFRVVAVMRWPILPEQV